jgi:hypothetical protein
VDAVLAPPFWTSFTEVAAAAHEVRLPEWTIDAFEIEAKRDELSPAEVSGAWTAGGPDVRARIEDLLLESLNPYVAPVLGYRVTGGRLSSSASIEPAPRVLESTAEVVLRGVDVLQTGIDVIQQQSGVPLPIALGLIASPSGEIRLTLPLRVNLQEGSVALGSVVWQAVRSAIAGALASPLRLLGSLFGTGGAPHAFAIDPIPFRSGEGALDGGGRERVAQIARILQAHPGLALVAMPQITAEEASAAGTRGAAALAVERSEAVRQAFTGRGADPRLAADRLLLVPWKPSVGAAATGRPGVYVELQDAL